MRNTRVLFAASLLAGAGAALAAGCGSSKSSGGPGTTGASDAAADVAEEASGGPGAGCGFIGSGVMSCDPGMGLSCCINLLSAFTNYENQEPLGTCQTNCTESISYQCLMPTDCTTGQACCGSEMGDASAALAELAEAGDAALPADASITSALSGDAASSITAALGGISFTSTCQASCQPAPAQTQLCATTQDCKANPGYICAAPPASLFGGAAGATGGLGGANLGALISIMVCQPPPVDGGGTDAGGTTATDAGGTDAGSSATDAGGTSDAGTGSTDAGATDGPTSG